MESLGKSHNSYKDRRFFIFPFCQKKETFSQLPVHLTIKELSLKCMFMASGMIPQFVVYIMDVLHYKDSGTWDFEV